MFKVARWRNQKIKTVFRLQFQATQVINSGSRLMISVIPADVGQPTVRLGKAVVEDGACTWENPIYETVKFIRETKTGRLQDKIYHFILATGSCRKRFLGEVSINFADYAEALMPVTVSLPITASSSGAILHVTIQNLQGDEYQRDIQENQEFKEKSESRILHSQLSNSISEGNYEHNYTEGNYYDATIPQADERSRTFRDWIPSSSAPAPRLDPSPRQDSLNNFQVKDCSVQQNSPNLQSPSRQETMPQRKMPDTVIATSDAAQQSGMDSLLQEEIFGSISYSKDAAPDHSEKSSELLQRQISVLERQAQVTELELESLRRQTVKETKRGQELSRQIISLTKDRDALKTECETLKLQQRSKNQNEISGEKETRGNSQKTELEEELIHQKDLNKALRLQLQKTQDSNSELILVVKDLEEMLGKKEKELSHLSVKIKNCSHDEELENKNFQHNLGNDKELICEEFLTTKIDTEEANMLKEKITDLQDEIEGHIKEREQLKTQIIQLTEDCAVVEQENDDLRLKFDQKQRELIDKENQCTTYMGMIEELEDQIARLEKVIKKQADEHSESSDIILKQEMHLKRLEKELEEQSQEFEANIREMTNAKIQQEQKALQVEEELRIIKLKHATAAQQLQEEFRKLTEQLASKFDENEKLSIKAQTEASELRLQITILQESLQKANEELELIKYHNDIEMQKLSDQLIQKEKEGKQLLKLEDICTELKNMKQKEEEKCEVLLKENQLLRTEIERLTEENYHFSKQLEQNKDLRFDMEHVKTSMGEREKLLELTSREKDDLERKYASVRMQAQQSQEELNDMRSTQEKKDGMIESLQSDVEKLTAQHNELKKNLFQVKSENDNLRKQLTQQKEDLQKKDHVIGHIEEKFKNSTPKEVAGLNGKVKQLKGARGTGMTNDNGIKVEERRHVVKKLHNTELCTSGISSHNGASKAPGKSRKETCIEKNQKVHCSQISNEGDIMQLLTEIASLKEKNRSMEDELTEMQGKYSEVSLRFAEVEGERQQLVMTIRNLRNGQKK
ncbi:hypothetical protein Ancab_009232 [Ancistrocladus abbreviatus]